MEPFTVGPQSHFTFPLSAYGCTQGPHKNNRPSMRYDWVIVTQAGCIHSSDYYSTREEAQRGLDKYIRAIALR